jgi:metal-responsive CopG/Arc/MetJ family transcriptional regulator
VPIISVRLTDEIDTQLDHEAAAALRRKSELIRDAIANFLELQERARFRKRLLAAANVRAPAEALAIAEEFLPLDNEALAIVEAPMVREVRGRYRVRPARHK